MLHPRLPPVPMGHQGLNNPIRGVPSLQGNGSSGRRHNPVRDFQQPHAQGEAPAPHLQPGPHVQGTPRPAPASSTIPALSLH